MSHVNALFSGPLGQASTWRAQLPALVRVYGIILTLVLLLAVVTIGNPAFISQQNIFNMASQWAPAGIMAVCMAFLVLTGGFDPSRALACLPFPLGSADCRQTHTPAIAFTPRDSLGP